MTCCEECEQLPGDAEILRRGGDWCVVARVGILVWKLGFKWSVEQLAMRVAVTQFHPRYFVPINYDKITRQVTQPYIDGRRATVEEQVALIARLRAEKIDYLRDVSTRNIVIDRLGNPNIVDFDVQPDLFRRAHKSLILDI